MKTHGPQETVVELLRFIVGDACGCVRLGIVRLVNATPDRLQFMLHAREQVGLLQPQIPLFELVIYDFSLRAYNGSQHFSLCPSDKLLAFTIVERVLVIVVL